MNSQIKISMFDDRIEIVSPGGLSKEEYLLGQISILRNPILANLFYRLGLIEQFGMGIRRIISSYQGSVIQPKCKIFENSIVIILPLFQSVLYVGWGVLLSGTGFVETDQAGYL